MPFKFDGDNVAVVEHEGKRLPIFIHTDGRETPFDADSTLGTISRLNGEAKTNRERAEKSEGSLKLFEGLDAEAARAAIDKLSKLDHKKLIDSGEVDKVRDEVAKSWATKVEETEKGYKTQLNEANERVGKMEQQLYSELIGGAFARSKYIADKLAIPPDLVQARFGGNFKVEDGKIVAYDNGGNKLYSTSKPGEVADPEEALATLVEAYPYKDKILKSSGSSGGGAQNGGGGGAGGPKTLSRDQWDRLTPADQSAKMRDGFRIV